MLSADFVGGENSPEAVLVEYDGDETIDPLDFELICDELVESPFGGLPGDFLTFPDSKLTPVVPATTGVVNVFLLMLFVQLDVVFVAIVVVALVMVVLADEDEDEAGDLDVDLGDDFCCGDPFDAELNKLL